MNVIYLFKYIWYRNYQFNLKSWSDPTWAMSQALVGLTIVFIMNGFTLVSLIETFTGFRVMHYLIYLPRPWIAVALLSIHVAILTYWIQGGRYKQVVAEFEAFERDAPRDRRIRMTVLSWGYQAVSVILFVLAFLLFYLSVHHSRHG